MASAVGICNLALGHLGDKANVQSISPPESTVQAEKCAQFYPVARDALLEAHAWSFNTRRIALAAVPHDLASWAFAYSLPNDVMKPLAVLPPNTTDENAAQAFVLEADADGNAIIYTNQEDATLRYQVRVTDTTKFTPLFVTALSWLLASYLAGPVLRGRAGVAAADRAFKQFVFEFGKATSSNANASKDDSYRNYKPTWITDR